MAKIHHEKSEFAGKEVKIISNSKGYDGATILIEDWWDHLTEKSWMDMTGNPACLTYAIRSAKTGLPMDNEVLYGKINGLGCLVHMSEIVK